MEHLRRVHAQENAEATVSSARSAGEENTQLHNMDSDTDSESACQTSMDLDVISFNLPQKTMLQAKLRELEALKENWVAKMDGDIEAMKRVLSLM